MTDTTETAQRQKITAENLKALANRLTESELYDFLVGDSGNRAEITGPITDTTGSILVETEFGVLHYEPETVLTIGRHPKQEDLIAADAATDPDSGPMVRVRVCERIRHDVYIPEEEFEAMSSDEVEMVIADATSGAPRPGHDIEFVEVDERDWEVMP